MFAIMVSSAGPACCQTDSEKQKRMPKRSALPVTYWLALARMHPSLAVSSHDVRATVMMNLVFDVKWADPTSNTYHAELCSHTVTGGLLDWYAESKHFCTVRVPTPWHATSQGLY